jgi:hypothetical protein
MDDVLSIMFVLVSSSLLVVRLTDRTRHEVIAAIERSAASGEVMKV